jgi:hypothetical protein
MTSGCTECRHWIPRSMAGDISEPEQQSLDRHLTVCPSCRLEHDRYRETLRMLRQAEEEPVPRHFFVYPKEQPASPWHLFRQMMPRWQALTAVLAVAIFLLFVAGISGLQVRAEQGAWIVSFGAAQGLAPGTNREPAFDADAFKAEILKAADEQNRRSFREWYQSLEVDLSRLRGDITRQQQAVLDAALSNLESRFNDRIILASDALRDSSEQSILHLYQTVSRQHQEDMQSLDARLLNMAETSENKSRQTDAILDTLVQVANMSFRQPGDQR